MKMSPLVNRPNIGHQEANFEHEVHSFHQWCNLFGAKAKKNGDRQPLFVRINGGPIQCELCGTVRSVNTTSSSTRTPKK